MEEEKLTQGPWVWDMEGTRGYPVLYGGADGGYAVLGLPGDRSYLNPESPDARLIAAAPELLKALKVAEVILAAPNTESSEDLWDDALRAVRQAISKATKTS